MPKWNSNIPKANSFYLFGASKHKDILVFKGSDFIGSHVATMFHNHFGDLKLDEEKQLKELKDKVSKQNNPFNPFGLFPKIRVDFLNKEDFVFGNNDKLDIFQFAAQMNWKNNALNLLKELNKESNNKK